MEFQNYSEAAFLNLTLVKSYLQAMSKEEKSIVIFIKNDLGLYPL